MSNLQTSQPSSSLYLINTQTGPEIVNNLQEALKADPSKVISVEKIKGINEQPEVLSDLLCDLLSNSEILKNLISSTYKLQDNKEDYLKLLNSVSFFLSDIEKKIQDVNQKLIYTIEYEEGSKS